MPVKICLVLPAEEDHGIQCIGDGRDFLVERDRMDGIIEVTTDDAVERSKRFALETGSVFYTILLAHQKHCFGVQWHPELIKQSEETKKLFSWLLS